MASEWPTTTVGKIAASISDTHLRKKKQLIFLNTSDVSQGKILHCDYTSVSEWPGQAKKSIKRDDILFSEIRPANGRYAYVDRSADDFVVSTKLMVIRADRCQVLPKFLYHFLTQSSITAWLQFLAESRSGTFPQITFDQIAELELPLPPIEDQTATAGFADFINDKIELNRKMNETLETMARALFKSWFVDFDPVRAKAESRDPGLPAHIAALFPDSFEDSELGEIPRGWSIAAIRDITSKIQYGLTASAQAEGDGPKFLRITDIQGGRVDWSRVPRCNAPQDQLGRYQLKPHDIFVARTGASTGENIYLPIVPDAVFASYLVRFQFEETAHARLIGAFMRSSAYFEYVQNSIGGSAQPNASAQVLAGAKLVMPPRDLCRKYAETLVPIDQKIWRNLAESEKLSELRDTLLPKLVSGEVRLGNNR
jgi:type I restriction enzyme S subunit